MEDAAVLKRSDGGGGRIFSLPNSSTERPLTASLSPESWQLSMSRSCFSSSTSFKYYDQIFDLGVSRTEPTAPTTFLRHTFPSGCQLASLSLSRARTLLLLSLPFFCHCFSIFGRLDIESLVSIWISAAQLFEV